MKYLILILCTLGSFQGYGCECNDAQNAIQILCNQKHYELINFRTFWHHEMITPEQKYWYTLGQCDGLIAAHEEILRTMKWDEPNLN